MANFLFQIGLSNAFLSLMLAIAAMIVSVKTKRSNLAYMLWLLVFIKLVTPPVVRIPIISIPQQQEEAVLNSEQTQTEQLFSIDAKPAGDSGWVRIQLMVLKYTFDWFGPIWLFGSIVVFILSLFRVVRFNHLLSIESDRASGELQAEAVKIAKRLKLKTSPTIYTTSSHISPMVWWIGGKVRIFIPIELLSQMEYQQWQWILAHELAHVCRRDYLVRWLEWTACVCFWWNPVVLFAQRNLRAMEEICCDELVISSLNPKPKFYANSLLSAIEFLAKPVLRPPAIASEINSDGFLERRFKMIIANKTNKSNLLWLQVCILILAAVILPLGIASAQDYKAVGNRLKRAVGAGELTSEQASVMLDALRKSGTANQESVTENNTSPANARAGWQESSAVANEQKNNVSNPASAQIDAQTEKKLNEIRSVLAGDKLTKEETQALIKEIRSLSANQNKQKNNVSQDNTQTRAEIRKAVTEGKLSKEEAQVKLAELRKKQAQQNTQSSERLTRQDIVNTRTQLQEQVTQGKLTKQEAQTRIKEMQKLLADQKQQSSTVNQDNAQTRAEIRKAVTEGNLSKEEAQAKLAELRKKQAQKVNQSLEQVTRQEIVSTREQLQKEIAEGKITKKQAQAKLAELRKKLAEQKSAQ